MAEEERHRWITRVSALLVSVVLASARGCCWCKYLNEGDWDGELLLLDDMCKQCGVNDYTDEEYEAIADIKQIASNLKQMREWLKQYGKGG